MTRKGLVERLPESIAGFNKEIFKCSKINKLNCRLKVQANFS